MSNRKYVETGDAMPATEVDEALEKRTDTDQSRKDRISTENPVVIETEDEEEKGD